MGTDLGAYRRESLATWREVAPGWEARHDWLVTQTRPVTERMLELAGPEPGQRYLDLAAGTGALGLEIAGRVGRDGEVVSADLAPEMVEAAGRIGAARGVENVDFVVADAEQMDLDADSFDGVVCRWAYMVMADPAAALAETRRVLRPDGVLSLAVWSTPEGNPWAAVPAATLVERGHMPPPEPGDPGMFAMGHRKRIRSLLKEAGFQKPRVEEVSFHFYNESFDDLWAVVVAMAAPLARAIDGLDEADREATREALREKVSPYRVADGSFITPAAALVACTT